MNQKIKNEVKFYTCTKCLHSIQLTTKKDFIHNSVLCDGDVVECDQDGNNLAMETHSKLIKDAGKVSFSLLDFMFLKKLALHFQKGLKDGRKRDDWKKLDWNVEARQIYIDALLRHTLEDFDPIAIAANCMIIWCNDIRWGEKLMKNGISKPTLKCR